MIRLVAIWMLAVLGLGMSRVAAEEDFYYPQGDGKSPDHLVPVPRTRQDSRLWVIHSPLALYEVTPSFSPAYCASVWAGDGEQNFWITVSSTAKFGEDRSPQEDLAEAHKQSTAPILVEKRKISKTMAVAIQRVWRQAVLKTRYADSPPMLLDGTIYYFSAAGSPGGLSMPIEGKAGSLDRGTMPAKLAELGYAICELATHPEQKEEPLIARLRAFEKELTEKK